MSEPETPREAGRQAEPEWVALAADIRRIDGDHDMGAGALAEALTLAGWSRAASTERAYEEGWLAGLAKAEHDAAADRAERGLPLDVERLRRAIFEVSIRHDWANTLDTEDRTDEIAAEYAALTADPQSPTGEG